MFAIVLLSFSNSNPKLNAKVKQTSHVRNLIVFFMIVCLDCYVKTTDGNRVTEILCVYLSATHVKREVGLEPT